MKKPRRVFEPVEINLSEGPSYEAAAKVFAILAFPERVDSNLAIDFWHALCRQYLLRRASENWEWATQAQLIKPFHFTTMPDVELKRVLRTGFRRLRSRVASALDIVQPHLYELAQLDGLPTTVENLSLRMKRHLGSDDDGGDINNVKVNHWRPSRPVLHLACAFSEMEWDGALASVPFYELMQKYFDDPDLLRQMLGWAEEFRIKLPELRPALYRENEMIPLIIR